ncbi:Uma2 family endonuclease [Stackebrandtia albiflava]|uniref:Uma2 family endonuclease n=1 Tax=Stackebrandtia albiflava TaxID=406432 RepID=UPI0031E9CAC0
MTLPDHDTDRPPADLLDLFHHIDAHTPPGYRTQLIDQEITVTPPPQGDHEGIVGRIIRAIYRGGAPKHLLVSGNRGLVTPRGRFIPDVTVADESNFTGTASWADPAGVELVCEVTSRRADTDRDVKRLGYAQAGIPLYLLIDRDNDHAVLYSQPDDTDYQAEHTVKFGGELTIPAPVDTTIDTTEFP